MIIIVDFDILVHTFSHLCFHLSHVGSFSSCSWRAAALSDGHSHARGIPLAHSISGHSSLICFTIIEFILRLLHLQDLHWAILFDELIGTHVSTTYSDDELTVDDLGENLFGTEEILTRSNTFDWEVELMLVQVESEELIDCVTLDGFVNLNFFNFVELSLEWTPFVFQFSSLLVQLSKVLEHFMDSLSVLAVDVNHIEFLIWFRFLGTATSGRLEFTVSSGCPWRQSKVLSLSSDFSLTLDVGWDVSIEFVEAFILLLKKEVNFKSKLLYISDVLFDSFDKLLEVFYILGRGRGLELSGVLFKFWVHLFSLSSQIILEVFKKVVDLFKLFVSSAEFLLGVPFNNLVLEFIDKSFALFDFLGSIVNFTFKSLKHIDGFRLLNLHKNTLNLINLLKVASNVSENIWHFILQCLNEFLFFVSGAVTVHFTSTVVDLLEVGLCNFKSFTEFVVFNFKESGGVLDVLEDQEVVQLVGHGVQFLKSFHGFSDLFLELSDLNDDWSVIVAFEIFLLISVKFVLLEFIEVSLVSLELSKFWSKSIDQLLDVSFRAAGAFKVFISLFKILEVFFDPLKLGNEMLDLILSHGNIDSDFTLSHLLFDGLDVIVGVIH